MSIRKHLGIAMILLGFALPGGKAGAATLVQFTYGTGAGTNVADQVAANASATPTVVYGNLDTVIAHDFIDVGGGDLAIHSANADGNNSHVFRFSLIADPAYRLHIDNIEVTWGVSTYSGGGWGLSLAPNSEGYLTMFSGGGLYFGGTPSSPASPYWNDGTWDTLVSRTDLQSLQFQLYGGGSVTSAWISHVTITGEVLPTVVPAPPALWLFGTGLVGLLGYRRCR
jgi:hypothetical protein